MEMTFCFYLSFVSSKLNKNKRLGQSPVAMNFLMQHDGQDFGFKQPQIQAAFA